jgi:hypothetical protein
MIMTKNKELWTRLEKAKTEWDAYYDNCINLPSENKKWIKWRELKYKVLELQEEINNSVADDKKDA